MTNRVTFFPSLQMLSGNPYWSILAQSIEAFGWMVENTKQASFSLKWLVANRGKIQVLHFHYIQQYYAYEHTHARIDWVLRFARNLLAARFLGYHTVFTLHNLTPTYPLQPGWVDRLGHWIAANLTASVIVHCEVAREMLAEEYGRERSVHVVPHPNYESVYPNEISREDARERLGLSLEQTVFTFLGGIRPNKGIETLIKAFCQLPGEQVCLVIAGCPLPPAGYVEELTHLASADPRIRFYLRFIPDEEIQVFLNAADIITLPFSRILTSGSAILAMTFGRPVIAPAMGCLPELITPETGWIYEPNEIDGLKNALCLGMQANLQPMQKSANKRVKEFSWEKVARQTIQAYLANPFQENLAPK